MFSRRSRSTGSSRASRNRGSSRDQGFSRRGQNSGTRGVSESRGSSRHRVSSPRHRGSSRNRESSRSRGVSEGCGSSRSNVSLERLAPVPVSGPSPSSCSASISGPSGSSTSSHTPGPSGSSTSSHTPGPSGSSTSSRTTGLSGSFASPHTSGPSGIQSSAHIPGPSRSSVSAPVPATSPTMRARRLAGPEILLSFGNSPRRIQIPTSWRMHVVPRNELPRVQPPISPRLSVIVLTRPSAELPVAIEGVMFDVPIEIGTIIGEFNVSVYDLTIRLDIYYDCSESTDEFVTVAGVLHRLMLERDPEYQERAHGFNDLCDSLLEINLGLERLAIDVEICLNACDAIATRIDRRFWASAIADQPHFDLTGEIMADFTELGQLLEILRDITTRCQARYAHYLRIAQNLISLLEPN